MFKVGDFITEKQSYKKSRGVKIGVVTWVDEVFPNFNCIILKTTKDNFSFIMNDRIYSSEYFEKYNLTNSDLKNEYIKFVLEFGEYYCDFKREYNRNDEEWDGDENHLIHSEYNYPFLQLLSDVDDEVILTISSLRQIMEGLISNNFDYFWDLFNVDIKIFKI